MKLIYSATLISVLMFAPSCNHAAKPEPNNDNNQILITNNTVFIGPLRLSMSSGIRTELEAIKNELRKIKASNNGLSIDVCKNTGTSKIDLFTMLLDLAREIGIRDSEMSFDSSHEDEKC